MKTNNASAASNAKIEAQLVKRATKYAKILESKGFQNVKVEEIYNGTSTTFHGNGKVTKKEYKTVIVRWENENKTGYLFISDSAGNGTMMGMGKEYMVVRESDTQGYFNITYKSDFVKICADFKALK